MIQSKIQPNKTRQILLVCNECIKANMAGPAIRYWEFARVLSRYFSVILAVPPLVECQPSIIDKTMFTIEFCQSSAKLKTLVNKADVIITVGINLSLYPFLTQTPKPLVVDMYIPFMLEDLQKHQDKPLAEQMVYYSGTRGAHSLQIRSADFIICASEKQKDFWLGWLAALGRVNPFIHKDDATLAKLIAVVPFGLPDETPIHDTPVIKGVFKTISTQDKVILWGGGLWNWLDPQTLVKAMAGLADTYPDVKLFFMGTQSPNPATAKMQAGMQTVELSKALGLFDKTVFFNDWTPYSQRHNYLLEADIGVNLHRNHLETRFAFRTRMLDYVWAGLPILTTQGDVFSTIVDKYGLGKVVTEDVVSIQQGLVELLETPNLKQKLQPSFSIVQQLYHWESVMHPLIAFCANPYRAADKEFLPKIPLSEDGISTWRKTPRKAWQVFRSQGPRKLFNQLVEYWYWKRQK